MNKLQRVGRQMFSRYLLVTNTVTCGGLLSLGDFITQHIERLDQETKEPYKRTGRMFCMGFMFGPFTHAWYKILDKYLPGKAAITVVKKILSDQAVAAPFFCSSFFMGMSLLEGKTVDDGIAEVKAKFVRVYLIDWCVWPPAQSINFFLIPPKLRVLYVSTVTLFWNTFLSWMKHKEQKGQTMINEVERFE